MYYLIISVYVALLDGSNLNLLLWKLCANIIAYIYSANNTHACTWLNKLKDLV